MTNFCNNTLTATGTDLSKFKLWLGKRGLSFEKIISIPNEISSEPKIAGAFSEQFQWKLDNWGTKFDITTDDQEIEETESAVLVNFNTQWTPPVQAIGNLSKLFPELTFSLKYCRVEEWFAGSSTANNGEVADNRYNGPTDKNFIKITSSFGYSADAEIEAAA